MGIRDRPTAPRSPWQNGYAERFIGSIRRECLDHVIVFGEQHLRRVLRSYQQYYNGTRTHLSLAKDAPLPRAIQTVGSILPLPVLGGLHHHYVRFDRPKALPIRGLIVPHARELAGLFTIRFEVAHRHQMIAQAHADEHIGGCGDQ